MKKLNCEICGAIHNLDRHHVIPKRMGGRKDPAIHDEANIVSLCRTCHGKFHQGLWELVQTEEGIWVLDKHAGETVMRRLRKSDMDAASLFQLLNHVEGSLSQLFEALPYLADDMLVEVFSYAASFGKRAWLIRAAIFYESQQRSIYGDKSLETIARKFEISPRQAQKYALVWKTFFADNGKEQNVNVDAFSLEESSWYVVAATETDDPEKWLGSAQDRKAEDPRYSVSWFRQDILRSNPTDVPANPDVPRGGLETRTETPILPKSSFS